MAMDKSVLTSAFPLAGTTVSSALDDDDDDDDGGGDGKMQKGGRNEQIYVMRHVVVV